MIFLLRVLNVLHKIAMVTFLWLTLNWLHDLSNDIHERCHDKPLHDRQHEWPHWQYHDRPKLWYQGSFAILQCFMCVLKTLAWWDEKSHWLHLVDTGVKCDTNTDDISWKRLAIKTNVTSLRERESLFMSWIHSGTFRVQICDWSVIINDLPVFICQRIYGLLACLSGSRQMARNIPEFSGRTPHSNKYFHIFALPRPQPPYIRTQKEPLSFSWNLSTRNE